MPTRQLFKVTTADGRPVHGGDGQWSLPRQRVDGSWEPGAWWHEPNPVACKRGLHLANIDQVPNWAHVTNGMLWLAQADEALVTLEDGVGTSGKVVVERARLLRPVVELTDVARTKLAEAKSWPDVWVVDRPVTAAAVLIMSWIGLGDVRRASRPPWAQGATLVFGWDRDKACHDAWHLASDAQRERAWLNWLHRPLPGQTTADKAAWRLRVALAAARAAGALAATG